MKWDEEIDLLAGKRSGMKHRRRVSNTQTSESPDEISAADMSTPGSPEEIPIKSKKPGWWSDEWNKSKVKSSNIIEQERFQNEVAQNSDEEIPVIPDIDDVQDDPLKLNDVKIPNITVKESTYKELDNQFQAGHNNFGNLCDIDLSILTCTLYPEEAVHRCTQIWTNELLYQDISKQ